MPDYLKYLEIHEPELVNDIFTVCRVNSERTEGQEGAPYGVGPKKALETALELAKSYGFSAEIRGDRVLCVELGEGEPELAILAHLDVVPAGDGWTKCAPYEPVREGDMLYGRGVSDDKGPAIASLYALKAVKDSGVKLNKKVQLLLGSCEETGSDDIDWYLKNYKMPPMVFTPDGDFPLVNVEKGRAAIRVFAPGGDAPSGVYVKRLSGGTVANAVPGAASCGIVGASLEAVEAAIAETDAEGVEIKASVCRHGNVHVTATGVAAHASLPENGRNAVCALLKMLSKLDLAPSSGNRALLALGKAIPFGDYNGLEFGGFCEDSESGKLTVNLGIINYAFDSGLEAVVDMRIPVCGDGNAIAVSLRENLGGDANIEVLSLSKPHCVPAESRFVRELLDIYEKYTGSPGEAMAIGGGTYVHDIEGGIAFGCTFPGRNPKMHEPDENMPVSDLKLSAAMFAEAIERFCGE